MRFEMRAERRIALLEAAMQVFGEKGYAASTIADVAKRAGMGKGTVYGYFKSKDELFFELFEWYFRKVTRGLSLSASAIGLSARGRLLALGDALMQSLLELLRTFALTLEFWAATASSVQQARFKREFAKLYAGLRQLVAGILQDGITLGEFKPDTAVGPLSVAIVAMWDGAGLQHWVDRQIDPARACQKALESILDGIQLAIEH
jgi:AcrR family transcriptional regulator